MYMFCFAYMLYPLCFLCRCICCRLQIKMIPFFPFHYLAVFCTSWSVCLCWSSSHFLRRPRRLKNLQVYSQCPIAQYCNIGQIFFTPWAIEWDLKQRPSERPLFLHWFILPNYSHNIQLLRVRVKYSPPPPTLGGFLPLPPRARGHLWKSAG